jgi:DNA-binding Xre family transcriptional regulator
MSRPNRCRIKNDERLNLAKEEICIALRKSMARKRWNQTELAEWLGTTRSCVCRVQARNVKELTFNQLFRYLSVLEPEFKILISI